MANAGLQIINDGGSFQIDQTYRNLCLREKGTIATTATLSSGSSYVSFNRTGLTSPIIAVGGSATASVQTYWDAANSRHGFLISVNGAIGTSVTFYIFDVPKDLGATYGFQVRDASGVLLFDATQPPLRVRGFYPNQSASVSSLAAGRTYAIAHLLVGFRAFTVEALFTRMYGTVPTTNGFSMNFINYSSIPSSPTQTIVRLPTLMAIDVTNY